MLRTLLHLVFISDFRAAHCEASLVCHTLASWLRSHANSQQQRDPQRSTYAHTQVIPGKEDAAISALAWCHDSSTQRWRLFSAGLDGLLLEWDLKAQKPLVVSHSIGGAAWALVTEPHRACHSAHKCVARDALAPARPVTPAATIRGGDPQLASQATTDTSEDEAPHSSRVLRASPPHEGETVSTDDAVTRFALAADDGSVRLLTAEAGGQGLVYQRMLGRASARALSLAWSRNGSVVFAGFADGCIRALNVATGARRRALMYTKNQIRTNTHLEGVH